MEHNLQNRLSRIAALKPVRHREPLPGSGIPDAGMPDTGAPSHGPDRLSALLGAQIERNRYGEYLVARQWHPSPEMCAADLNALSLLLPPGPRVPDGAAEMAMKLENWLFLDTETTGLAGGTGTYAFLVGLAWWDAGGLQVEQLFMRDHDEEHAVLLQIERRLQERPVLVTFNGKSFDWPLLETRFRMTRAINVPALGAHLDLLHPARQLWRWQIGSVRLGDLERHVLGAERLGWSRRDDIDSSRIPEFYFDYLRTGAAEPVAGVFRHNSMDLRGLAALAGRVFGALGSPQDSADTVEPLELYGVSRFLGRRGQRDRACESYERALAAGLPGTFDRAARHELARLAKRQRQFGRAAELWQELADSSAPSFEACEQLAIHFERRGGDLREAERATRVAIRELRRAHRLGLVQPGRHAMLSARLERRLQRLTQKSQSDGSRRSEKLNAPDAPAQGEFARE